MNTEVERAGNRRRNARYRERLGAKYLERIRKWKAANLERGRELNRQSYYANHEHSKERARANRRAAYLANPKKYREYSKEYRAKNREKVLAYAAAYKEKNRASVLAWQRNRDARKKLVGGTFKRADIFALLKRQHNQCAYCRKRLIAKYNIDHIIPLSAGGSNWPRNLQITCPSCNVRKAAKRPEIFARECGLLI